MTDSGRIAAILPRVAAESGTSEASAAAVAKLLGEGCTIPFIARYRKEAHGNLDEVAITKIRDRLAYHTELEERREFVLATIESQGKLTPELKAKILACTGKTALEDLYQPYKPKRRTRAMIAKEKGLEPLADSIWKGEASAPALAGASAEDLQGARDIIAERIADLAEARGAVRAAYAKTGVLKSEVAQPPPAGPTKFEQYYDFSEPLSEMPSHRFLAIKRGQKEGVLWVRLSADLPPLAVRIREILRESAGVGTLPAACEEQLAIAISDAVKRLLAPSCEIDVTVDKKMAADRAAVEVFAENLRHLLLASPLGGKVVLAIDPGIRTGCKTVVVDATGKFLVNTVIYPSQRPDEARETLARLVMRFSPAAVAVGNGTAGRETESFARAVLKAMGRTDVMVVPVSESGASVYSASPIARDEFPDLDLTVRGAISIGRRLQDPLAELVKIDPKAIGVGQYQHDVQESLLGAKLDEVVESCVNAVGVELNTASAALLRRVSGIGEALAKRIVEWRDANGAFKSREELKKVPGLGPKAFEQSAGFLRVRDSANPLDASAVHPERYALVERMAADLGVETRQLVGDAALAGKIDIRRYISNEVGEPTLRDILLELKKPGRDPRDAFEKPAFRDDVTSIDDVKEGMRLEGVVTNVTAFGAFVDIGIHQDGLVHVSELADRFVRDPSEVVKAGDRVKVRVLAVDKARNRVSLSCRSDSAPARAGASRGRGRSGGGGFSCNPFANL